MIVSNEQVSPIFLSVILIVYLLIVELGNEKMKKRLMPTIIVLLAVFAIVAIISIVRTWIRV